MPRKLPWATGGTVTRPTRSASSTTPAQKRLRVEKSDTGTGRGRADRLPSSSPPPEAPSEIFMNEGFDHDDKYRMVEDEFLTVAQKFTVHLHAAEYKRLQKMAKSRNAETINSISRPVTGIMPDHTKRKLDSVDRAKKQKSVVQELLGKKGDAGEISDESDDDGLPYVGTTLHGLMDSPRRKAVSLSKLNTATATTRAAAGFKKPSTFKSPEKSQKSVSTLSPRPKKVLQAEQASIPKDDSTTESSADDDDDLDGPISAPKFRPLERKLDSSPAVPSKIPRIKSEPDSPGTEPTPQPTKALIGNPRIKSEPHSPRAEPNTRPTKPPMAKSRRVKKSSPARMIFDDFDEAGSAIPRSTRLERARLRKFEGEKEQAKKKLDIIPTFI